MKSLHSEIASEAIVGHKYHSSNLPVCSLHVRMKLAITHAKLIFDRNFLLLFLPGEQANLTRAQAQVCPGVATPLVLWLTESHHLNTRLQRIQIMDVCIQQGLSLDLYPGSIELVHAMTYLIGACGLAIGR